MSTLKNILLLLIALCIVSAVTGIQSANVEMNVTHGSSVSSAEITETSTYGRLLSLLYAIMFAAFYYGIHKKLLITWRLGWIVVLGTWLGFTTDALSYSLNLPSPDSWVASIAIVISGCAGLTYWGIWWKRQKPYFNVSPSK